MARFRPSRFECVGYWVERMNDASGCIGVCGCTFEIQFSTMLTEATDRK